LPIWPACCCALFALPMPGRGQGQEAEPVTPAVTITAQKAAVVKKLDKTVYDVAAMARAANGSAQDVLQSTPEVAVASDGAIAVHGNARVTVLIDGKPTAMTSSSDDRAVALQTMSGADIVSIEVITNPSAAYHANGGAILNIVLKRNRQPGAHAQLRTSASDHGLWNVGADGNVTRGPVSVHGSLALRHDGNEKIRASQVDWTDPRTGQTGQTRQTSDVFVHRVVQTAALGADVALSAADSLSLSARRNTRRSHPRFDVLNENRTGAGDTVYHRTSDGPNEQSDHSASLGYSRQDRGAALKATLQHSATTTVIDKSYHDVYSAPVRITNDSRGDSRGVSRGTTGSARRLDQATLDWTRAVPSGSWGLGVDVQDQVDDLHNYQASVDPATGAETPDPLTTNGYQVRSRLAAAYVTEQVRRGRWEVLLGVRAERLALRVGDVPAMRARAVNPSLHLRYAWSDRTDLTFSHRRSLQAPDAPDLNPNTTYIDAHNLSRGNPRLAPQHQTSWELGASREAPRWTVNVGAFHRTSRDTVTDARSIADNVLITSKQNGGQARSTGITAGLDWKREGVSAGMDGGVYRVAMQTPDLSGLVHQDGTSAYLNLRAAYRLGQDDVALDAHGQSAGITPLGRYGATSNVNLTWKRQLTRSLSLTVNANDLFDGSRRRYRTDTSTFHQAGVDHVVARRLYVGLVQKFG
jgi:outer membrane receptor protein involved in Fe transport